jgi:hypothetical protein
MFAAAAEMMVVKDIRIAEYQKHARQYNPEDWDYAKTNEHALYWRR